MLQFFIATRNWSILLDWLWFLVASPLLYWAIGGKGWFAWPIDDDDQGGSL